MAAEEFRKYDIHTVPVSERETDFLAELFYELIKKQLSQAKNEEENKCC